MSISNGGLGLGNNFWSIFDPSLTQNVVGNAAPDLFPAEAAAGELAAAVGMFELGIAIGESDWFNNLIDQLMNSQPTPPPAVM